ncbi:MAG TPA: hypothetical protein VI653_29775 [Steroidobacteraceae bacterium]
MLTRARKRRRSSDNRRSFPAIGASTLIALAFTRVFADPSPSSRLLLTATVSMSYGALIVQNHDAFAWKNCVLRLNPHGLSDGYAFTVSLVKSADEAHVLPSQFVDENGLRFDLVTHKPMTLVIQCDIPGGRGIFIAGNTS